MKFDPISQDPPTTDDTHPAGMMDVLFESHGAMLNGIMYTPQGKGPHPTIVLLHGFPGHERNFDLAQVFRRAGYNVVVFHYRGAWGSGGNFAFKHVLEDTETVLQYLRLSEIANRYRVDTDNMILMGHSMGGWAALSVAAKGLVKRVAAIAAVNMGLWGESSSDSAEARRSGMEFFEASLPPLNGTSAEALIQETIDHMDEFDLMQKVEALAKVDVFLVAGIRDQGVPLPLHHTPLVKMIQKAGSRRFGHIELDADHGFNDKRITLARVLIDWLED